MQKNRRTVSLLNAMKKTTKSLSTRLILIFILVLALSTATIGTISYYLNRRSAVELNSARALSIARTVASAVDVDAYKDTVSAGKKTEYWYTFTSYLDDVITKNNLVFLYVLSSHDDSLVTYFAEGMVPGDLVEELEFGDTESLDVYDENILDVFAGADVTSKDVYDAEEWGFMVSGIAPIFDKDGSVIGVVGADVAVNEVLTSSNQFGLLLLLLILGICIVVGISIAVYLKRSLGNPIAELTEVSKKIASGDPNIKIKTHSNTEIGVLADSFREMVETINQQTQALQAIAAGDLSVKLEARSENDIMNHALIDTVANLNDILSQITTLTSQVSVESSQIASSAQSLAKGASSQASAVEELSSSINEIAIQTRQNTELAEKSATIADDMREKASSSYTQMQELITAVSAINEASTAVRSVLRIIEDVAFQTNILSLNASVEAARAGEHGTGFAVVSKEIQNLSKKTSDSAKETAELVADTIQKTKLGVSLAQEVFAAMQEVVANSKESDTIANDIAMSSKEQMMAIEQINLGIDQVAIVVHQNSTVADESAMVSRQMNKQAENLSELVSRFKTKK